MEVVGKKNLLVEMLYQNVLKLSDPLAAVLLMGDVGAQVTMYYMELELCIREKKREGDATCYFPCDSF